MRAGKALTAMIYPHLCAACGKTLSDKESSLCLACRQDLPRTGYWLFADNPMEQALYGRVPVVSAAALFFFREAGPTRRLLHLFKYNGHRRIGLEMGRLLGRELAMTERFKEITVLVPVPLHWTKRLKRGYNQAMVLAQGMGAVLNRPIYSLIKRKPGAGSQTRLNRLKRWENVSRLYRIRKANAKRLERRIQKEKVHFLLVDDVFTTGATIEACAAVLHGRWPENPISVCTLAYVE